jgi:hypothetical protein
MNNPQLLKRKFAAGLAGMSLLLFTSSASAALVQTVSLQQSATSFTPTWTVATSLIHGLSPSAQSGNFTSEANAPGVSALTDGAIGPVSSSLNIYAAGGPSAGNMVTYTLPAQANGYNLTNITVYSGWANGGRVGQGYTVYYSTVANTNGFIPLTTVSTAAGQTGNNPNEPVTIQVILADSAGAPIAANVAQILIDFTTPPAPADENAGSGYSEITVQGTPAATPPTYTVTTETQQGSAAITGVGVNPFTPTYTLETPSLIAGLAPSTASGNFGYENTNCNVDSLTDNGSLTINAVYGNAGDSPYPNTTTSTNYVTCGANNGTGSSIIYTLPSAGSGVDVTNIVVYNGWKDTGRMGQYYILSYSTVSAPSVFIPITTIDYLPSVTSGLPTANRVAISDAGSSPMASGVYALKFDFASPYQASSFNNGFQGYAQIIVQGQNSALPPSAVLTQDILPSYAATVVGDQIVFTSSYSNSPPVATQWLFNVTNTITSGVVNVTNNGVVTSTLTVNNLQLTNSGTYQLEGLNSTNGVAPASFSSAAQLVVNSAPAAVGGIVQRNAEQAGEGAITLINGSTNFYPTWTVNTANDLIQGFLTNASPGIPGTSFPGTGNFNYSGGSIFAPDNADPTILSDGSDGYVSYWPNVGGNVSLCACGTGGAGDTMTYTLPSSAAYGFDLTNITVFGGWGDHGRNEQKYQILYSTMSNPTAFVSLGTFDFNPNDPANQPSATRTMLIPVSGALAKNVYAVEINWNVASPPKNGWEGYSEIVVQGTPSVLNPILMQDILPAYAETMVGDTVVFTAAFSNSPPVNLQWQYLDTNSVVHNISGATTATLTLDSLQLTNTGSYRLQATSQTNSQAVIYSTASPLVVNPVPAPVNNIVISSAGQTGWGPGGVGISTNFTPTWTANTNNDLILGSFDGGLNTAGAVAGGGGNFGIAGCYGDPAILSDGTTGTLIYDPGTGGNSTLDSCGPYSTVPNAVYGGVSLTYTLNTTAATNGFDLTNVVVYGGWGDSSQNEQKYMVLYSTVGAPNTFIPMTGWVDYVPNDPNNWQSATRTTLTPAAGVMAQNVYAVQISFNNQAAVPKGFYSGYSEIIVDGQVAPPRPFLTQDVSPTTAEDVVGSQLTLTAGFINATSYQWLKDGTNLPGATLPTLTLSNLQLTDMATNGGYQLMAFNAYGTNMTSLCSVYVDPAPSATNNVIASADGNVVTAVAYQTSAAVGFSPTWDTSALPNSLIYQQNPPGGGYDPIGDFTGGGDKAAGLSALTDGNYGMFANDGTHPAFAACGDNAGEYAIYTLGANANGYTVTNIQIAGGWNDNGRDSQYYTVTYATVANPTMFFPMVAVANNLYQGNLIGGGNGLAVGSGAGNPTMVRTTFVPAAGALASNVGAIFVDFQFPGNVPNGYSGYSEISVFGTPTATSPPVGPVITTSHEETNNIFVPETPNLIANQLPSSYGAGVFSDEGCNETNLTDGVLGFGAAYSASCGDDGTAVPWLIFSSTNSTGWNLTNIVVYSLWHDYGRDGQYYNLSYSTVSAPNTFLPLASVAYNPFVPHDGRSTGNRVQIAPPAGQTLLASNVAAVKFDFSSQGTEDFGWSGYTQIILQGANLPPVFVPALPTLARPTVSGGKLIVTGTGGTPNQGYTWLSTASLAAPIHWTTNTTGVLDGSGSFSNAIPITVSPPDSFFRFRMP